MVSTTVFLPCEIRLLKQMGDAINLIQGRNWLLGFKGKFLATLLCPQTFPTDTAWSVSTQRGRESSQEDFALAHCYLSGIHVHVLTRHPKCNLAPSKFSVHASLLLPSLHYLPPNLFFFWYLPNYLQNVLQIFQLLLSLLPLMMRPRPSLDYVTI